MRARHVLGAVFAIAAASSAGCSRDVIAPPETVWGYDLTVSVAPARATKGVDAVTGLPIAAPDEMNVPYTVKNVGTHPSPAHRVVVWVGEGPQPSNWYWSFLGGDGGQFKSRGDTVEIASLSPGDSITGIATVRSTRAYLISEDASSDSVNARARLLLPDTTDLDKSSDTATSTPFYVAVGIVSMTMDSLILPKLRTNEAFPVTLRLTNHSRHAPASGITARLCTWDLDYGCGTHEWTWFGRYDFPVVAPGATIVASYTPAITASSMSPDYAQRRSILGCIAPASWSDPYLSDVNQTDLLPQGCVTGGGYVVVRPDIRTNCNPPLLSPDVKVVLAAPNCGLFPLTTQPLNASAMALHMFWREYEAFYAYTMHGVAGTTYSVVGGQYRVVDSDAEPLGTVSTAGGGFRVTRTGTYFVIGRLSSATLVLVKP